MKILLIPLLALVASAITGCATTAGFEHNVSSWVGSNIKEYVRANQITPTRVHEHADGTATYHFSFRRQGSYTVPTRTSTQVYSSGNYAYATTRTTGGYTVNTDKHCIWTFEVDTENVITHWSYRGNACKAHRTPSE